VHIFAAQEYEFRLVSIYQPVDVVKRISVSPGGDRVICLEGKFVTILYLEEWKISAKRTEWKIEWPGWDLYQDNFRFLTRNYDNPLKMDTINMPLDSPPTKTSTIELPGLLKWQNNFRFVYKPKQPGEIDCLIAGTSNGGVDQPLLFLMDPMGEKRWECYVNLVEMAGGRFVLDRFRESVYLVVATHLTLEAFLDGKNCPVPTSDLREKTSWKRPKELAHLCVYQITFEGNKPLFVPRFYLGPRKSADGHAEEWYPKIALDLVWSCRVSISTEMLTLKVDDRHVAHCSLVATPNSMVVYQRIDADEYKVFACSQHSGLYVYFPSYFSHWTDVKAQRECPHYAGLFEDDKPCVQIDLHAPLIKVSIES
jgi:hypothetical protein